jgi:hypothetical protein
MDDIDRAQETTDRLTEESLRKARDRSLQIPKGQPGDCDLCGYWSGRLVKGVCAPCRDKHHLP